jgi:hypothetical protein
MWLALAMLVFGLGSASNPDYGECAPGGGSRTLKLDVSVDPTIVVPTPSQDERPRAPHTSRVRVTVTNPGPTEHLLTFPDPCYLGFAVETADGLEVPRESGEVCLTVLGALKLAPGESRSKEFRWTARTFDGLYKPLPAGEYRIVGTLAKRFCGPERQQEPPIRTAPVTVEVRPAAN